MQANLTGNLNTAMGYAALKANLTNNNSSFGARSLQDNTTGTENAAFGEEALTVNTTGSNLSAFGAEAGKANTTGSNNTYIGAFANTSLGTISNSIALGYNATVSQSNTIQLGNTDIVKVNTTGTFKSNGIISNLVAKNSSYTISNLDEVITADGTSSAFTITLPTAIGITGQTFTIKRINSGSNTITVGTTLSQTIDGSVNYSLSAQYKYIKVVSDGANWIIVGNN